MRLHYTTLINIQKTCRISSADFLICFSIQFSQYSPASLMTTASFEQIPSHFPAFASNAFSSFIRFSALFARFSASFARLRSLSVFFRSSSLASSLIQIISRSNTLPPMISPIHSFTLLETRHLRSFLISIREPNSNLSQTISDLYYSSISGNNKPALIII